MLNGFSILIITAACLTVTGCSSIARRSLEVRSQPAGADVTTLSHDKLGVTPLVLSGDSYDRAVRNGKTALIVSHPGYLDTEIVMDTHGEDVHELRMTKLDEKYFSDHLMNDFSTQANEMAKDLLNIHGMLISKKFEEAENLLMEFQKRYPNVASSYVMRANISIVRGNPAEARGYLLRAQSIDPSDPVVERLLGRMGGVPQ